MKKLLVPLLVIIISGCVNTSEVLNSWIGASEDQLVSTWGVPTSTYKLNNGFKLIEYKRLTGIYGQNHCTRTFTINTSGIVTNWKQTGLGC